jgi:hypothetical protein
LWEIENANGHKFEKNYVGKDNGIPIFHSASIENVTGLKNDSK